MIRCVRLELDFYPALPDKNRVFSRMGHLLLIVAFLGTMGAHWAVMQSVAWATMLADNSRVAPLSEAFERTFDGKHPCALCKQVAQGRHAQRNSDIQAELKKLDFLNQALPFTFSYPEFFVFADRHGDTFSSFFSTPPFPPPRSRFV